MLSLEQVFKRLDTAPAASGPLDLDLAVRANGANLHALLASLSGQVSGSIREGNLADRTINLADGAIAAKVVGETIGLAVHLLGSILGADGQPSPEHKPCAVVPGKE